MDGILQDDIHRVDYMFNDMLNLLEQLEERKPSQRQESTTAESMREQVSELD
jgi:hypothetical protein